MLTETELQKLSTAITKRIGSHFKYVKKTHGISFQKGLKLFFDFIKTPFDDEERMSEDTLFTDLYSYYVEGSNHTKTYKILKNIALSLDPLFKKILYYSNEEVYSKYKDRAGLGKVTLALKKLIKDSRTAPKNILYGKDDIEETDRGKPKELVLAYDTRNIFAHDDQSFSDSELIKRLESCVITYLYAFFEYLDEIRPNIKISESAEAISMFLRSLDNWDSFIQNSQIQIDGIIYSGYSITQQLCKKVYQLLRENMTWLGRALLCDNYEDRRTVKYIFYKIYTPHIPPDKIEEMINRFQNEMKKRDYNGRWEYQKNHVGSTHYENNKEKEALRGLGSTSFYEIPYQDDYKPNRQHYYDRVIQDLYSNYGFFIDGFKNAISTTLEVIDKSLPSQRYITQLNNNLKTKFDYLLLLYLLLAKDFPDSFVTRAKKYIDWSAIVNIKISQKMLDLPNPEQIQAEIDHALKMTKT